MHYTGLEARSCLTSFSGQLSEDCVLSLRQKMFLFPLAAMLAFNAPTDTAVAEARTYRLATASAGGTYYPVGVALATLIKVKLTTAHGIGMEAINSAGSEENIYLLRDNEAQFAILQGLFGHYASNGTGPIAGAGPQKSLRAVTMLWRNVEQFILDSKFVKSGTMADLAGVKGMGMALGKKNSGTLASNRVLLGNLGYRIERDFELLHLGYGPSAASLRSGHVAGMGTPAGLPTGTVARVKAAMGDDVTILSFTADQSRKADGGLGLWTRYTIPANTYPNQKQAVQTIAQPNILVVRDDVDDRSVYLITKTVFTNLTFLNSMHAATKDIALGTALTGLPMPLHPGAMRYFKEAGLTIPATLVPP
jgi:TRAP transporter TAXI family solute receptor